MNGLLSPGSTCSGSLFFFDDLDFAVALALVVTFFLATFLVLAFAFAFLTGRRVRRLMAGHARSGLPGLHSALGLGTAETSGMDWESSRAFDSDWAAGRFRLFLVPLVVFGRGCRL